MVKALRSLGAFSSYSEAGERLRLLKSRWTAETAMAGMRSTPPFSSTGITRQLIAACDLEWDIGAQDAALVLLCQRLTVVQVMALTYEDLIPGVIREGFPAAGSQCVRLAIQSPDTEFQHYQSEVLYIGWEVDVLSVWGTYLQFLNVRPESPFIWGSDASRELWASRRFRMIVDRSGLPHSGMTNTLSPSRFRGLWERDHRGTTIIGAIAHQAGLHERSILNILKKR